MVGEPFLLGIVVGENDLVRAGRRQVILVIVMRAATTTRRLGLATVDWKPTVATWTVMFFSLRNCAKSGSVAP